MEMTATCGTQSEIETAGTAVSPYIEDMPRYRFLDGMGDVMDEHDFPGHAAALAWARDEEELDADVQRVESPTSGG
jgi:hypothetical protein